MGDLDHYIEFHIDSDQCWKMRIDWRAQQAHSDYFITQEHDGKTETVNAGFCRESRGDPTHRLDPAVVDASAQAADINVAVPEIREKAPDGWTTRRAAVITRAKPRFNAWRAGDALRHPTRGARAGMN